MYMHLCVHVHACVHKSSMKNVFAYACMHDMHDVDPAFRLNRGILDIRQWVGLCIN